MVRKEGLRLRTVVALDDDEFGDRMRLPYLDIRLVLRRAIAGQRRLVIGKFDHDISRSTFAFDSVELAATHDIASTELLEDGRIGGCVRFVAFLIVDVDATDPIPSCHFRFSLFRCFRPAPARFPRRYHSPPPQDRRLPAPACRPPDNQRRPERYRPALIIWWSAGRMPGVTSSIWSPTILR